MPYDPTDPRSQMASTMTATVAGVPRPASYRELSTTPPDEAHAGGGRTWWTRSQAMVIAQSDVAPGDSLDVDTRGESMVITAHGAVVNISAGGEQIDIDEASVVIVPPGPSTIAVAAPGTVFRVFAAALEPALADRCANAEDYRRSDANVAPFAAWPDPPEGFRLRAYRLADYPPEPGRLGRIFRCTTAMVNVFEEDPVPRDPAKLSPHHHDDFEQVSLQVQGDYVHHMRVPWTPDSTVWRDDEHRPTVAPAVVVIPPPLVHTSQSVGDSTHWLIDVFAPPRHDFSQRPGWVLNAADYPSP